MSRCHTPKDDHFVAIYRTQAAPYHRLIEAEDLEGNVAGFLAPYLAPKSSILDVGTGTGRLLRSLPKAVDWVGLDLHRAMLQEAQAQLPAPPGSFVQANMGELPFSDQSFDLVLAGWALGHQRSWNPEHWAEAIRASIQEMDRVLRPGGHLILFETQGTGTETPCPPPGLDEVLALYRELGFEESILRTDYGFESPKEARETLEFFFGIELAEAIEARAWARVPECTGAYVRAKPPSSERG